MSPEDARRAAEAAEALRRARAIARERALDMADWARRERIPDAERHYRERAESLRPDATT